jgi:RNA polymerase primary sigma factor
LVQRQVRGCLSYWDSVQEGRIALWRSLEHYDAKRGRLSGYAVPAIKRALWTAAGKARRHAAHEPLQAEPAGEPWSGDEALDRALERMLVRRMVARLPRRLRTVIILRYGLDGAGESSFVEIGQALGVSKQRAHQLHQEAILLLADPAGSIPLRRQMGRNRRADIQGYLTRRRAWQHERRCGR